MPRRAAEDDWNDDEEDGEPTVACPYCRRQIHEESVRCPYCEKYLSDEDVTPQRKPWWIILGVLLAFYAIYRWIVG